MAGIRYQLVNVDSWRAKLAAGGLRGQTSLILKELIDAHPAGLTSAEISELIKDKLVTRQPVERVVGFYMSIWKKAGHIRPAVQNTTAEPEDNALQSVVSRPAAEFVPVSEVSSEDEDESGDNADDEDDEDEDEDDEDDELKATLSKTEKMKDAVLAIVNKNPGSDGDQIVQALQEHWRTGTTRKQVNDCLLKMAKADEIRRHEHGGFFIPAVV